MPNEAWLDEYVLNDHGILYQGSSNSISASRWYFGQVKNYFLQEFTSQYLFLTIICPSYQHRILDVRYIYGYAPAFYFIHLLFFFLSFDIRKGKILISLQFLYYFFTRILCCTPSFSYFFCARSCLFKVLLTPVNAPNLRIPKERKTQCTALCLNLLKFYLLV